MASLAAAIGASATHGLDPNDYHAARLWAPPVPQADEAGRVRAVAQRDVLATDAFVRLAYHLYFGKADPRAIASGWNFARTLDGVDPATALSDLLAAPDAAAALQGSRRGCVHIAICAMRSRSFAPSSAPAAGLRWRQALSWKSAHPARA